MTQAFGKAERPVLSEDASKRVGELVRIQIQGRRGVGLEALELMFACDIGHRHDSEASGDLLRNSVGVYRTVADGVSSARSGQKAAPTRPD